jgi:hypothetical protein
MNNNTLESIAAWHALARPEPDFDAFNVQLGCHFEEIHEMCESLSASSLTTGILLGQAQIAIKALADHLKYQEGSVEIDESYDFLDALCDQQVTGVGTAYCANMNILEGLRRVNESNWSKFVDGRPVFDAYGKIAKPDTYRPATLNGCV